MTVGYDPLRDEGQAEAERLSAAGAEVQCRHVEDVIHGFIGMLQEPAWQRARHAVGNPGGTCATTSAGDPPRSSSTP